MLGVLLVPGRASAYSVLTHEAIVDELWETSIVPLLRAKFHSSDEDLQHARAYAYGGCMIQDIGYYPFSSRTFGDLAHYVRTGDFVMNLLDEARDANEYAFALGALVHYAADTIGHPVGINVSVPLSYPKIGAKLGPVVTYEQDPTAHLRTEFGFDVIQVARGLYTAQKYRAFIGFEVSKPVLERAFLKTYGSALSDHFASLDLAIGTFRRVVSTIIPTMTKIAWETKRAEIERMAPDISRDRFILNLTRRDYEQQWGTTYQKRKKLHAALAGLLRIMPRVGPFKVLSFRPPSVEAEKHFLDSVDQTLIEVRSRMAEVSRDQLRLPNLDFDTGRPSKAGEYRLADESYAGLLHRLTTHHFEGVTPSLRANILAFYSSLSAPAGDERDRKDRVRLQGELAALKQFAPALAR